jgi:glycosyltransferase involved in cell wall biosynthesis
MLKFSRNLHLECIDPSYSTTRLVTRVVPKISDQPGARFQTILFIPSNPARSAEGGLRTQGFFKAGKSCFNMAQCANEAVVTVITATFNAAQHIEKTILSVLNQSYNNVEYIIIDGGSTDGTLDIIRKYQHAIDYWISEPDKGIYDAWNKGICLSQGEWIAFLGADDILLKEALQSYVALIASYYNSPPEYVSSRVNLISGTKVSRTIGQQWRWKAFRSWMNVAHVGSLHSRSLFERYGLYDTSYRICADYEFLLRPGASLRSAYMDSITAYMRIGGISNSLQALWEAERAKVSTGGRSVVASRIERLVATGKFKLRKWLGLFL